MGYRGKIDEQNRARDLRAKGWTYNEIVEELGVSKSSVSLWCRDVEVDPNLLDARRRARYRAGNYNKRPSRLHVEKLAEIERYKVAGRERMRSLSEDDHLLFGLGLYAGDGSKRDGAVRFANSNPSMIEFFVRWLRRHFEIDEARLRVRLYLHEGLDLDAANQFWSDLARIPLDQFGKPYRAVPDPTIRTAKYEYGCAHIGYSCSRTQREILGLMGALLGCDFLPG